MKARINIIHGTAQEMAEVPALSVDLMVTSPPYPMIEMWDEIFARQDKGIGESLAAGAGAEAFESMHRLLDGAWNECDRALKPGGLACINIGDATRTLNGDFQLYSNHSRILKAFLDRGYAVMPDILWRKPTNAPNKFMGSGMLPVGAYVTYEHEYILILRKGLRRKFTTVADKKRRRESAFFWEERNVWFSDVWHDIRGTTQALADSATRKRSAAFPFELAYRLICMFSIKGDVVLDPFVGTGTTLAAALAAGRDATGVEFDTSLAENASRLLESAGSPANSYTRERLTRHVAFARRRSAEKGPMKHVNSHYGFPVVTSQERELIINDVTDVTCEKEGVLNVEYDDRPQADFVRTWTDDESAAHAAAADGKKSRKRESKPLPSTADRQEHLDFRK
jgi:modification methylase